MAQDVDIRATQIVLQLRGESCKIRLICAGRFDGFDVGWSRKRKRQYRKAADACVPVRYISTGYSRSRFQIRNEWMADHAVKGIAGYDGIRSGVKNTIDYAEKVGVPVIRVEG